MEKFRLSFNIGLLFCRGYRIIASVQFYLDCFVSLSNYYTVEKREGKPL